jgi:hypothetical protein
LILNSLHFVLLLPKSEQGSTGSEQTSSSALHWLIRAGVLQIKEEFVFFLASRLVFFKNATYRHDSGKGAEVGTNSERWKSRHIISPYRELYSSFFDSFKEGKLDAYIVS